MSPNDNGGRITTREFYDALIDMDRRLGDKIDNINSGLAKGDARFAAMDKSCIAINKRIDTNSADIKKVGGLNGIATIVAATIAGIIGVNK